MCSGAGWERNGHIILVLRVDLKLWNHEFLMFGKANAAPDLSKCLRWFFWSLLAYPQPPKAFVKLEKPSLLYTIVFLMRLRVFHCILLVNLGDSEKATWRGIHPRTDAVELTLKLKRCELEVTPKCDRGDVPWKWNRSEHEVEVISNWALPSPKHPIQL